MQVHDSPVRGVVMRPAACQFGLRIARFIVAINRLVTNFQE